MVINLNKKLVTKQLLLDHVSDLDIYRFYLNKDIEINTPMSSPLRVKDEKPSFAFFLGVDKQIYYKDFVLGGGDCIKFVQKLFNLNFNEALSKIVIDFELTQYFIYKNITNKTINSKKLQYPTRETLLEGCNYNFNLGKKSRKWTLHDLKYWMGYNIDIELLDKYNVEPIDYIFIDDNPIKVDYYTYCFSETKDNKTSYKIYQPYSKNYKWLNNHNDSIWQGWTQLPEKGDLLVITKSLKDVMCITNTLGIPAVSLQAEGVKPKDKIIDELKSRFKEIKIFYDNDFDSDNNWGREFGKKLSNTYGFHQIEVPDYYKIKDFSDLVKEFGAEEAKRIWRNHINIPF